MTHGGFASEQEMHESLARAWLIKDAGITALLRLAHALETRDAELDVARTFSAVDMMYVDETFNLYRPGHPMYVEDLDQRYQAVLDLNGLPKARFEALMEPAWHITLKLNEHTLARAPIIGCHGAERTAMMEDLTHVHHPWGLLVRTWTMLALGFSRFPHLPIPSFMEWP